MSSTNKTAELHLSQFIGTDIPSILTDYNGDMQKIDAGVREVKQATAGAVSDLSSVTARVTNAEQDISGLNSTVQGIATRVVTAEGDIDNLQSGVAQVQGSVSQIEEVVPSTASASNKLATMADIGGGEIGERVDAIEAKIPANASASNQMATASDITSIRSYIPSGTSATNKLLNGDTLFKVQSGEFSEVYSISTDSNTDLDVVCRTLFAKINEHQDILDSLAIRVEYSRYGSSLMRLMDYDATDTTGYFIFGDPLQLLGSSEECRSHCLKIGANGSSYYDTYRFKFANKYYTSSSNITDGTITGYDFSVTGDDTVSVRITVYTNCKNYELWS